MSVIANTTVLSNWAAIGEVDVLRKLFARIYVTTEVYEEVRAGFDEGYAFYESVVQAVAGIKGGTWIEITSVIGPAELRLFSEAPARLHCGETSCIAVAKERGWLFLSDDADARKHAQRLGVTTSGTLGCLVLAVERRLAPLETANAWLQEMRRHGYRSPVAALQEILRDQARPAP